MSTLPHIGSKDYDNFSFERDLRNKGFRCIAGSDEVGRGPLAGPVVAACVSLPYDCDHSLFRDSKIITHQQRLKLSRHIVEIGAAIGIGIVSHRKIDAINILQASLLAMKLAVFHHTMIARAPDFILVDGKFEIPLNISQQALIKGETKSASIAAASIVAKVKRDAIMDELHQKYPLYCFDSNKGYPTKVHRQAVATHGPCPFHRSTFRGVKEFVTQED